MSPRLFDKIAIVTGSSQGIGRAIALAFHREGAKVICADIQEISSTRSGDGAQLATHETITKDGGSSIFIKTDVANATYVERLIKVAVEVFGRLDMSVPALSYLHCRHSRI